MSAAPTRMRAEIEEIPDAAARLAEAPAQRALAAAAARVRDADPHTVVTVARGSSDHAASCLAHAVGTELGLPVASLMPGLASVHGARLEARGTVALAVSQSGRSSDLLATVEALAGAGAPIVALANTPDSPLGRAASLTVDVAAGPERAVAATKSCTNSILAGLWLVAHLSGDDALKGALRDAPERLRAALERDASGLEALLDGTDRLVVLGRGPALGLAAEVALKCIETCAIHASAYSAAEVLHGPSAMLVDDFPVLVLNAAHGRGLEAALERLPAQGARLAAADRRARHVLPAPPDGHPLVRALDELVGAYAALEAEARRRGRDPDSPPNLVKATDTV